MKDFSILYYSVSLSRRSFFGNTALKPRFKSKQIYSLQRFSLIKRPASAGILKKILLVNDLGHPPSLMHRCYQAFSMLSSRSSAQFSSGKKSKSRKKKKGRKEKKMESKITLKLLSKNNNGKCKCLAFFAICPKVWLQQISWKIVT